MKGKTLEEKIQLKGKEKKRRQKRERLQELFELNQAVDIAHAQRTCEECNQCDSVSWCGWRMGLFLEEHRPDLLGVSIRGVKLEEQDVFLFRELRPGALEKPAVKGIARELGQFMPVLLVNMDDELVEDPEIKPEEESRIVVVSK